MAEASHIEWTDATWQPITGCSIVSPGCTHCYAMKLAGGRLRHHPSREGLTVESKNGPVWTGEVRFNEQWLTQPLQWRKPKRIFVCAHSDLFHEDVLDEWIDKVFAVMRLAQHHTFQVLTKRAERMQKYFSIADDKALGLSAGEGERRDHVAIAAFAIRDELSEGRALNTHTDEQCMIQPDGWPLPNVWLGVSCERQQEADERIPRLLQTSAAVRFISAEPLLGPIDLSWADVDAGMIGTKLDWVIVGGESGHHARRMDARWARDLRDQCAVASVPFFFKQWGAHDPDTFDLVGKKAAGRLLDGIEHNAMPRMAA